MRFIVRYEAGEWTRVIGALDHPQVKVVHRLPLINVVSVETDNPGALVVAEQAGASVREAILMRTLRGSGVAAADPLAAPIIAPDLVVDTLVGVIDEAVDATHPSLPRFMGHWWLAEDGAIHAETSPASSPWTSKNHGTFVAGIIAGHSCGGGPIGNAPGAPLAIVEVGPCFPEDHFYKAVEHLINAGCRVLNISLAADHWVQELDDVLQAARAADVLPVVAIGNDGPGQAPWPGASESALSVGNCTYDHYVYPDSSSALISRVNRPVVPLVLAPGVMVRSAVPPHGCDQDTGTSFAAPFVAASAAMLRSRFPKAGVDLVEQAIVNTCLPVCDDPAATVPRYAHGIVSPSAAATWLAQHWP